MKSKQPETPLAIGQVAALTGVNVQTLRFYERRGLLKEVTRTVSGYRKYSDNDISTINFIRRSQELGFSLSEIEDLLWLQSGEISNREEIRSLARTKIEDLEIRINNLKQIRRALAMLVDSCMVADSNVRCPILEAFNTHKRKER